MFSYLNILTSLYRKVSLARLRVIWCHYPQFLRYLLGLCLIFVFVCVFSLLFDQFCTMCYLTYIWNSQLVLSVINLSHSVTKSLEPAGNFMRPSKKILTYKDVVLKTYTPNSFLDIKTVTLKNVDRKVKECPQET